MNGQIVVGLSDRIALVGVAGTLLATIVAVWCVRLSLKMTIKVGTLIQIRDDVVKTLDKIEALSREVGDNDPLTGAVVQKMSNDYWEAKHQFEASCEKASIILSPKQIEPWAVAVPKINRAYDQFAESLGNHIVNNHALNDFKVALHDARAQLELIIQRTLLNFYQRRLARQLFESRQRKVREIRETNQM